MNLSATTGTVGSGGIALGHRRHHLQEHTQEADRTARFRASSATQTNQSQLSFQVKTAEGDTVTLSIQSLQQSEFDRVSYRSSNGQKINAASLTATNSLQAALTVEGSLSDAELQDIQKALAALSQGQQPTDVGTLASATYSYQNEISVDRTRISFAAG